MKQVSKDKVSRALALKKAFKPTRVNILALDQATKCGFAFETREYSKFGHWDLTKKTKESDGVKWLRFESLIDELVRKYKIEVIAYELPGGQHVGAKLHSAKLIAIIERLAAVRKIEYVEYSSKSIKKFATDNGNASKGMMIEAARDLLGYDGDDDNEADALWMLFYAKSQFN